MFIALWVMDGAPANWRYAGDCMDDNARIVYDVSFCAFFSDPAETVDWLAHLSEKSWFDWTDFSEMMIRLRTAPRFYKWRKYTGR